MIFDIKLTVFILLLPLFVFFSKINMTLKDFPLESLLPENVEGWEPDKNDKYFNSENLYEHINGGAELYISYGFRKAISRTYLSDGKLEINVDIFDMADPKNAFGVFTHTRDSIDNTFGQGCKIYIDAVIFWKGRFYVSVMCFDESESSRQAILKMAAYISENIPQTGDLPAILSYLPEKELIEESILYFHHHAWQNAFYYLSDENIFNITDQTDAVLAKYGDKENRHYLLLIMYPNEEESKQALKHFRISYLENELASVIQTEDDRWLGAEQNGAFVIAVFHANSKKEVGKFMLEVSKRL